MQTRCALGAELTIYTVAETRERLLAALQADAAGDADLVIDASAVSDVDGAGVQLLLSLSQALAGRQRRLALAEPAAPLRAACSRLGLDHLLVTEGDA
ncbi:MAG: STAS domain-containing protein [Piscinibacter sp.]|uniref:STAS domain-containing protein n=1 Tax=Piscinibacter TaxID=1114981 RepID=UPI000FDCDDBF|nr:MULTISPECIES: STAS domain-containing protein [Piscinibacter]MCW5667595.1 STAS domain-containing protein [Piscinibacter sp.]